ILEYEKWRWESNGAGHGTPTSTKTRTSQNTLFLKLFPGSIDPVVSLSEPFRAHDCWTALRNRKSSLSRNDLEEDGSVPSLSLARRSAEVLKVDSSPSSHGEGIESVETLLTDHRYLPFPLRHFDGRRGNLSEMGGRRGSARKKGSRC